MQKILKNTLIIMILCNFILVIMNYVLSMNNYNIISSNHKANLEQITSIGDLVSDKEVESLEDSGITGEDYTFDTTFYPYYGLLTVNEQILYKQIYANIESLSTTFVPNTTINTESVLKTIEAVFNDHPEFFWLDTSYSYKYTQDGNCAQIILNYNDTINNYSESKSLFLSSTQAIIDYANGLETDYEKEKYVHNILIELIVYDTNALLNQSAYSALVNNISVCAGYARAFQYIMIELGIPTYYVTGKATEEHAWNIVMLDDGYYNVDLTWDDTNGGIYNYFNVADSTFSKTHTRTGLSVYLPACTNTTYSNLEKIVNNSNNHNNSNIVRPSNPIDNSFDDTTEAIEEDTITQSDEPTDNEETNFDDIPQKEDIINNEDNFNKNKRFH